MTLVTRVSFCFFVLLGALFMPVQALAATHTVLPGECLYDISSNYGITVEDLMEANGISDNLIYPGQELSIPGYQAGQDSSPDTSIPPEGPPAPVPAGNSSVAPVSGGNALNTGSLAYTVQPGDSLCLIAQKHGTTYQEIILSNNLDSTVIYPGMVLYLSGPGSGTATAPQAVPQVSRGGGFQRPAPEDVDLLARLITAEADSEPYEGKVGVGAVVLNRVAGPGFPKTIKDVIYQQGNGFYQFTPVQNGWINRPASSDSIKAAKEALGGADPTNGAVYFFASYSKSQWLRSRPVSKTIGNMVFSF